MKLSNKNRTFLPTSEEREENNIKNKRLDGKEADDEDEICHRIVELQKAVKSATNLDHLKHYINGLEKYFEGKYTMRVLCHCIWTLSTYSTKRELPGFDENLLNMVFTHLDRFLGTESPCVCLDLIQFFLNYIYDEETRDIIMISYLDIVFELINSAAKFKSAFTNENITILLLKLAKYDIDEEYAVLMLNYLAQLPKCLNETKFIVAVHLYIYCSKFRMVIEENKILYEARNIVSFGSVRLLCLVNDLSNDDIIDILTLESISDIKTFKKDRADPEKLLLKLKTPVLWLLAEKIQDKTIEITDDLVTLLFELSNLSFKVKTYSYTCLMNIIIFYDNTMLDRYFDPVVFYNMIYHTLAGSDNLNIKKALACILRKVDSGTPLQIPDDVHELVTNIAESDDEVLSSLALRIINTIS